MLEYIINEIPTYMMLTNYLKLEKFHIEIKRMIKILVSLIIKY